MWNNWYSRHKGDFKKIAALVLCIAAALYGLCFYMSYKAADIFNQVVAERQLFPGTVTVERLTATPGGTVSFENLVWNDEDGDTLVQIPKGQFTVKLSDVLTGHIGTQTVEDVTLDNAYIHLIFNDKMELQHVKKISGHQSGDPRGFIKVTGPKGNHPLTAMSPYTRASSKPKRQVVILPSAMSSSLPISIPRARRPLICGPATFPVLSKPSPCASAGAWISNRIRHSITCPCC